MKNIKLALAAVSFIIIGAFTANAAPFDWSACKTEMDGWCPTETDDEKIYSCLHSHDKSLTPDCDSKAVTPYETKTSKAG